MDGAVRKIGVMLIAMLFLASCASSSGTKKATPSDRARILVEAAVGALDEKDPVGALQFLAQAESLDDSLPEIYYVRALAFYARKDSKSAMTAARRALQLRPSYSDANATLGNLLLDAGRNDEAEKYLKVAADDSLYRQAFKAQTGLGILYYRRGDFKQAEERLNQAIDGNPEVACVAHYYRGHIELERSKYKDAIRDYSDATKKLCGGFVDAQLALGIALERDKQYDRARKTFLDIHQHYPESKVAEKAMDHLRYLP